MRTPRCLRSLPGRTMLSVALSLIGAAAAPAFADDFRVAPTELYFGGVFIGESPSLPVVITNISGIPQTPGFAGGAPFDSDNFGAFQNCAGITLPPGGQCEFTYEFHPTSTGAKATSTQIGINSESYAIAMSGTGLFPIATSALDLDFGSVNTGDTATIPVVFVNLSSVPQSPSFAGGAPFDSANFGAFQNCAGVTLQPGASCEFTYEFHPLSSGPKS